MKQVQLQLLCEELFGRTMSAGGDLIELKLPALVKEARAVRQALESVRAKRVRDDLHWPPIWIVVALESRDELAAMLVDDDAEALDEIHAEQVAERWVEVKLSTDQDRLLAFLSPYHVSWSVDLVRSTVEAPLARRTPDTTREFKGLAGWVYASVLQELGEHEKDPAGYNQSILDRLPRTERFGRIRRRDFWQARPGVEHFIRDELTSEQRNRFVDLASKFGGPNTLASCTVADYLRVCAIAYAGAGYDVAGMDAEAQYRRFADGRHDGLLELNRNAPAALERWLLEGSQGGHPWEIARGGNTTHISLSLHRSGEHLQLTLTGSALTRAGETLRMALALHDAGVPFTLHDAELHRLRATGSDWIGLVPHRRWYHSAGNELFPASASVHDCVCQSYIEGFEALLPYIEWLDPELLERVEPNVRR